MEQILYLLLGWLFGLLSPNLVERLRRPCQRDELVSSVWAELDEMRYTMAHGRAFANVAELRRVLRRYLSYYNHHRLHSSLGYQSPVDYERAAA